MNCAIVKQYFHKWFGAAIVSRVHATNIWAKFNVNKWLGDLIRNNFTFCDPLQVRQETSWAWDNYSSPNVPD